MEMLEGERITPCIVEEQAADPGAEPSTQSRSNLQEPQDSAPTLAVIQGSHHGRGERSAPAIASAIHHNVTPQ